MSTNSLPFGSDEDGVFKTRVAVSCFGEEVAPCFDTARRFRYWEIVAGEAVRYRELHTDSDSGIARIQLLTQAGVHVLICNGITERLRELLEANECVVIDGVVGSSSDALFGLMAGQIFPASKKQALKPEQMQPHTADLVAWTEELFQRSGWKVRRVSGDSLFPIDLLAEIICPVCQKPVRSAICCGAHAYRLEEEIKEFKRISAAGYNARVYVHHVIPGILKTCRDFEIELLDPYEFTQNEIQAASAHSIAPLKGRILDHEAFNAA
ncbi:NifB/NifX family molybdenum-iron cluster-binding protein [bacterium]|nr:NifB/NifX family molybdenum-iron cluster-binding protein [bacterium]MBU1652529.1 NifB/NifX family molybdenum-iron cluster-binding protein [bacterium]